MSTDAPAPLPLTVVSGYLGSGKTTLVNHLLRHAEGRRVMVLVNDFGDIAIDAELIAARDGDSISLANGCVCCSIGGSLFRAFTRALDRRPRPDHLVIEASGVAEPQRITAFADAEPELRRDLVVTLADALNCRDQLQQSLIAASLERQFAAADLVVLNKADLVRQTDLAALGDTLRRLAPGAALVTAERGSVALDLLLGSRATDTAEACIAIPPLQQGRHLHEEQYQRWSFVSEHGIGNEAVTQLLQRLPPGLLRLKGIAYRAGAAQLTEFHVAGRHREANDRPAGADTRPGLRAVAIGHRGSLDSQALDGLFSATALSQT